MYRFLARLVVAAALLAAPTAVAFAQSSTAPVSIGMVDLQRALNEVEEGQAARTRLEAEFARRQEALATQQAELETYGRELEASMSMLTEEAARERYVEYQERAMALQQGMEQMQMELSQAEAEATGEIFERMVVIVGEIAAERGYTVVVEKSTIVFAADGLEFTDELIRRYNERY